MASMARRAPRGVGDSDLLERLLYIAIVGLVLVIMLVRMRRVQAGVIAVAAGAIAFTAAGAALWTAKTARRSKAIETLARAVPHQGGRPDYVSSDTCRSCHPQQYASWHASYHRTMTQLATPESVVGDFDDVRLESRGQKYLLERRGDEFWAEMADPDWEMIVREGGYQPRPGQKAPRSRHRIVITTGSHHYQTYWVKSPHYPTILQSFPFVYLFEQRRWIPREEAFLRPESAESMRPLWNNVCIKCHSTAGNPGLLPNGKLDTRVAEFGISCEACHGPAADHVRINRNPERRYRYHLKDQQDPSIFNPKKASHVQSAETCGQCHGMYFTTSGLNWAIHGLAFRPGKKLDEERHYVRHPKSVEKLGDEELLRVTKEFAERGDNMEKLQHYFWADGNFRVTGREYNALLETACFQRGELSCLSCHSMHESDPNDQLKADMRGNQACVQCHGSIGDKIEEHTHHAPDSPGSLCYNCHMPYTAYGLLTGIRTHQIDSPNIEMSTDYGRPNACNLCHLDQTLAWSAKNLTQWYGQSRARDLTREEKTISAALLWLIRGDAAQRAILASAMGWEDAREAAGQQWMAPFLAQLFLDPYGAVRYIAHRSLRGIEGFEDLELDFLGTESERKASVAEALAIWDKTRTQGVDRTGRRVLMDAHGSVDQDAFERLLAQRDDVELVLME